MENFYVGQFKKNKYNGKGIFYYRSNAIKYMGDFVDNHYEGNELYFMKMENIMKDNLRKVLNKVEDANIIKIKI